MPAAFILNMRRCLLLASVGGFLCLQLAFTWQFRHVSGVDFAQYYVAAKVVKQGLSIYPLSDQEWLVHWERYVADPGIPPQPPAWAGLLLYPPLFFSLLSPLTTIPWRESLAIWRCLSILALLGATGALSLLVADRWVEPMVFATVTLWVPTYATLYDGQVNDFILLTIVLFLLLVQRYRIYAAGLVLSAGLMLKPIAAPLLVYFTWRRDFRKLLAVLIGLAVMVGITVALAGPRSFLDYLKYAPHITVPSPLGPPITYPPNQSLFGFFGRALTAHPYGPSIVNAPEAARLLSLLAVGALLLIVGFLTWPQAGPDAFVPEIGLVLAAIPLVEPFGEYHHATLVIVPFLLSFYATDSPVHKVLLVAALVLLDIQGLFWHHLVGMTFLLSLGTYGLLIIFTVTAQSLRTQRKIARLPVAESQL